MHKHSGGIKKQNGGGDTNDEEGNEITLDEEDQDVLMGYLEQEQQKELLQTKIDQEKAQLREQEKLKKLSYIKINPLPQKDVNDNNGKGSVNQDKVENVAQGEADQGAGGAGGTAGQAHSFEPSIIRDGYRYTLNCKYKDKLFYKCEDKKNIGCKGVWKLYIEADVK